MSEAVDFDISVLNLDPALVEDINKVEPEPEPEKTDSEQAETESEGLHEGESDALAEMLVEGFEVTVQTFGHERYELAESKKALLIANYSRVLGKYQSGATSFLGRYTEEVMASLVTMFIIFMTYKTVKALKTQDRQAKGGKSGNQSESSA